MYSVLQMNYERVQNVYARVNARENNHAIIQRGHSTRSFSMVTVDETETTFLIQCKYLIKKNMSKQNKPGLNLTQCRIHTVIG
jgi:hypothetical protein